MNLHFCFLYHQMETVDDCLVTSECSKYEKNHIVQKRWLETVVKNLDKGIDTTSLKYLSKDFIVEYWGGKHEDLFFDFCLPSFQPMYHHPLTDLFQSLLNKFPELKLWFQFVVNRKTSLWILFIARLPDFLQSDSIKQELRNELCLLQEEFIELRETELDKKNFVFL